MTDHVRREIARRRRETRRLRGARSTTSRPPRIATPPTAHDDTLILLFMCCASGAERRTSAIALTLRAVGGLTTAEIASAFLVPKATMAQRISRAKQAIRESGVPFSLPDRRRARGRLTAVLHVLYLIFSEGYVSSAGALLHRTDLASEAIRLARAVQQLLPGRRGGGGPARADAPHRCPPRRAHGTRGRADPARRAGPHACGTMPRSRRAWR